MRAHGGGVEGFLAGPDADLRARLLGVHGIGPETAAAIMLYAARRPVFVDDAYARRLFRRLCAGTQAACADGLRRALPDAAGRDPDLLGEWHALIVAHGKARCRARAPRCGGCPLLDRCVEGRRQAGA